MNRREKNNTSWGHVARWYSELLEEGKGTYQKEVILPHLLRLLAVKKKELIVDLACGQGFFSRALYAQGACVYGADIAPELIGRAERLSARIVPKPSADALRFETAPADHIQGIADGAADAIIIVLALQNIARVQGVFKECRRMLKSRGEVHIVLNHPAFRVPKASSWAWDAEHKTEYRRVDAYLTESKIAIQMHPGKTPQETTLSFHRPLQYYVKALGKQGLYLSDMEEWISHKKSEPGPHAAAHNRARKEIPLFLYMKAVKV